MEKPGQKPTVTEGGLKQWTKEIRRAARGQDTPGYGQGRIMGWNRRAVSTFSQLRTGKGNLRAWKAKIDKSGSISKICKCGAEEETGDHVLFRWESYRKGWRTWEDIDTRWKEWLKPHLDSEGGWRMFCTSVQPG